MEIIKGIKLEKLGFTPVKQGDILYHDGPLISHFIDSVNKNIHYIYKWADNDDIYNRWLVFKITDDDLVNFIEKKTNWLNLIKSNSFVYLLDIDDEIDIKNITICPVDSIPSVYLPSENSFFKVNKYEKYVLDLYHLILKKREIFQTDEILKLVLLEMKQLRTKQIDTISLINKLFDLIKPKQSKFPIEFRDVLSNNEDFTANNNISIYERGVLNSINEHILN